ncbi:hypothetical protein [Aeoliella mucimassa]|uniref:Uncharacterized protein n=1 Tax=Aeoliella mucimassa TaxID=2527972 RepID=A0A518AKR0_9BACT|nr:hypothetical protein [Aeoliella mucimassa]QDU55286.1 hypothetical protein Pan181_14750 [Aeoliella mucimassa]
MIAVLPKRVHGLVGLVAWLVASIVPALALAQETTHNTAEPTRLERSLALDYWDESRFAKFAHRLPLSIDEEQELHRLVARLGTFDRRVFYASTPKPTTLAELLDDPDSFRGAFIRWEGEIVSDTPPATDAGNVHQCRAKASDGECVIYSSSVPAKWDPASPANRKIAVEGIFVKIDEQGDKLVPLIAAANLEWFPTEWNPPQVNYGMSVLGVMGVDVSLLDNVQHRQPLTSRETIAFYRLLASMKETPASQLINWADRQMPRHRQTWTEKTKEGDKAHRAVAQQVVSLARYNSYAVAPFFNLPAEQEGELVTFDGVVRRALRVEVASDVDADACGIDHYYELALFTSDSANNPVMFSVLELPDGFPEGEDIRESVRVAGFFFKNWRYTSRHADGQLRLAPLFVGRSPLQVTPASENPIWGWVAGLGFIGIVLLLWIFVWLRTRADNRFEAQTLSRMREPPELFDAEDAELLAGLADEPKTPSSDNPTNQSQ